MQELGVQACAPNFSVGCARRGERRICAKSTVLVHVLIHANLLEEERSTKRRVVAGMEDIGQLEAGVLSSVRGVFTDIDDTVSTDGKLTSAAFEGLWRLHEQGLKVVVVTGRPAGWCDHIARFWPVDAVVGENGGFYFHHDGEKLQRRYLYSDEERAEFRDRLQSVRERILSEISGAGIASDQAYREYDVAIDFCEDVPALPREQVIRIKELFEAAGATAKISSIHVNGWYGTFDKLSTVKLYAQEQLGVDLEKDRKEYIFCGDSPNDEPMFGFFPLSFGMANIRDLLSLMEKLPAYVTREPAGAGFREVVDLLLTAAG